MISDDTRIIDLSIGQLRQLIREENGGIAKTFTDFNKKLQQEFLSAKEFGILTSTPYSSVVAKCHRGDLKARQDSPNGTWKILATELERYKNEAEQKNNLLRKK